MDLQLDSRRIPTFGHQVSQTLLGLVYSARHDSQLFWLSLLLTFVNTHRQPSFNHSDETRKKNLWAQGLDSRRA